MKKLTVLLAAALFVAFLPATAQAKGWIAHCHYSHSANNDPIVFFQQPGASHLHDFVGSTTTNAFSTFSSLRAGGTNCVMPDDTSAYWVPALYENGVRVLPTGMENGNAFYYQREGTGSASHVVQPVPKGLKIILGNAHAQTPEENPDLTAVGGDQGKGIFFKCGPGVFPRLDQPPASCGTGIMVISFTFPNCWDGFRLKADDQSHMAYPTAEDGCPASHPVNIPRLQSFFRYAVGTGPIGEITLASGPYFTAHADFFNAWKHSAMQSLTTNCINGTDCGVDPAVP